MKTKLKALLVAVTALAALLWGTGTAQATIYWYQVALVNQVSGQCPGSYSNRASVWVQMDGACYNGPEYWDLTSNAPDSNGHAVVQIRSRATGQCVYLSTLEQGTSRAVGMQPCNSAWNQQWTMVTAAPTGNHGHTHYVTFYSFGGQFCLDGGYGFRAVAYCPQNNWQIWGITV